MKCNQKTIGQGTVFKSPHPSPGIRAGVLLAVLWKGAVISSLYLVGVLVQSQTGVQQ